MRATLSENYGFVLHFFTFLLTHVFHVWKYLLNAPFFQIERQNELVYTNEFANLNKHLLPGKIITFSRFAICIIFYSNSSVNVCSQEYAETAMNELLGWYGYEKVTLWFYPTNNLKYYCFFLKYFLFNILCSMV